MAATQTPSSISYGLSTSTTTSMRGAGPCGDDSSRSATSSSRSRSIGATPGSPLGPPASLRERDALLERLHDLSHQVLVATDVDRVVTQLGRLLVDIEHHRQRLHDLAYDDVELEIGGVGVAAPAPRARPRLGPARRRS